jgi:hypothetical protein
MVALPKKATKTEKNIGYRLIEGLSGGVGSLNA